MRFMYLVKSASSGPPPQRLMEELDKLAEREMKAGTVVDMGGLLPLAMGARVRLAGGKIDVTDGPFAESKEVVGGYAIFEYPSREEALASAVEFMNVHLTYGEGWEGECEMRQMAP
ncbi:MAG TPA: YciI family protein [Candidatus Lustribacter sp.]